MELIILLSIIILSAFLFISPAKIQFGFSKILHFLLTVLTSYWAISVFVKGSTLTIPLPIHFWTTTQIVIDSLSAFFILVINFTALTGILYAKGYLKPYCKRMSSLAISSHLFSFFWLHLSMLLVVMLREGFSFLVVWELMSVSSFLLVSFDTEHRSTIKIAINYLIQMHIGLLFILIAFLISDSSTHILGFDGLKVYFSTHSNFPLFLLFFVGFGIKAGFIPLHTWLPDAHPAAPSHVSGVMSGVMIKMGIYGIIRVISSLQTDLLTVGVFVFGISLFTGLLGIMMAIPQRDIKRFLAYSSIENIGIIGIGLGVGIIGKSIHNPAVSLFGFTGALLHILNHSLFKSLLFYSAGSVYKQTHTRNMEYLGGLIKKMPQTSLFFLLGSLAVCGLPPFNGFISEFLMYIAMFNGVTNSFFYASLTLLFGIIGLTLIGGLAIFGFTKTFGITFLGEARTEKVEHAHEVEKSMLFPKILIGFSIVCIGLFPIILIQPLSKLVSELFYIPTLSSHFVELLESTPQKMGIVAGIFVLLAIVLIFVRMLRNNAKFTRFGAAWGCGYTAGNAKIQYTSSSYSDNFSMLANPIVPIKKHFTAIEEDDIFPKNRYFETQSRDIFKTKVIDFPFYWFREGLRKLAVLQTGQIQHYILYAFLFIFLVIVLTYFKLL